MTAVPSEVKNLMINDSLADVLPLQKRNQSYDKHQQLGPTYQTIMVDAVTSGTLTIFFNAPIERYIFKTVPIPFPDQAITSNKQEFEHQAVPTVHETGIGM